MTKMDYEIIDDHTADIGFKIHADDLNLAFSKSALALTDIMVDISRIDSKKETKIEVSSEDLESLMFDFLSELLYLFDTEGFIASEIKELKIKDYNLKSTLLGDKFDPKKHEGKTEIKAITYHQMKIEKKKEKWEIQVIVDI